MSVKKRVKKNVLSQNFIALIMFTILITIIGFFLIEPILKHLFENKFIKAIPVVKFIIISWLFITLTKITNYPMSETLQEINDINLLAIVIFILNIVLMKLNYLFFNINALSVSIFFLISAIIHFLVNCIMMKKKLNKAIKST